MITVNGLFKEVGIENPDWCKIDEELRRPATVQQHKQHWESFDEEKQPNTEHAHEGTVIIFVPLHHYTFYAVPCTQKNNIMPWQ